MKFVVKVKFFLQMDEILVRAITPSPDKDQ